MMKNVLIIGDSCKDIYTYCDVKRLSPEKPVPVLELDHVEEAPGMAMNVYRNVCNMMPKKKVDIITNDNWETITKNRFVDQRSNHMFLRVDTPQFIDRIDVFKIPPENINMSLYQITIRVIHWDDITIFVLTILQYFLIQKRVRPLNRDAKFIKINNYEAERSDHFVNVFEDKVIQTLGGDGVMFDGVMYPVKDKVETLDVSGAGDTFLAALVVRYSQDKNIISAIKYANRQASKVVSKRGTSVPD